MKKLENKVAVVYGNGAVGGTVAKAFVREGARVFLTGRTAAKLEAIAEAVVQDGGTMETALLDALEERIVEKHMDEVIEKAGSIDISFNAIGVDQKGIQSLPLTKLSVEDFSLPVATYTRSHFITARAAASRMIRQGRGVILMHTPNASRMSPPFAGGLAPAWAAMEALCRSLSVECGQHGVRTVCLLTTAIPETPLIKGLLESRGTAYGSTPGQFLASMEAMTHRNGLTTLEELSKAAIFAASDEGSAMTGTVFNLTAGVVA